MQSRIYQSSFKRVFDIISSIIALIFTLPLFILISFAIKISSEGPIFYSQERVGRAFKSFNLYKFRSMVINADKLGISVTVDKDPRITRIGYILRKTKLDELPQLINVIKGDMSVVGPRPEVFKYINLYKDDYRKILSVRPGITDYASIQYRDEESMLKKYEDTEEGYLEEVLPAKIILYKEYISNISFIDDIKIIFKTLLRIIK